MVDRRFMIVFLFIFSLTSFCGFVVWRLFLIEHRLNQAESETEEQPSCSYEEIDLVMPVAAFLKRCANSPENSYVRRLFVNQWISSNQADLVSLIVYAQGATTYHELKKALMIGIEKVGETTGAAAFVKGGLKVLDQDPKLIEHINKSLVEGFDQSIHTLRGEMMGLEQDSMEYKKLKTQYRKQLELWIDQKHGKLLDEIIARL